MCTCIHIRIYTHIYVHLASSGPRSPVAKRPCMRGSEKPRSAGINLKRRASGPDQPVTWSHCGPRGPEGPSGPQRVSGNEAYALAAWKTREAMQCL